MRMTNPTTTAPAYAGAVSRELAAALDTHRGDPISTAAVVSWILAATDAALEPALAARAAAIRQLRADGFTLDELAELTGLSRARIDQIARR